MVFVYGTHPLSMNFTDEELKTLIDEFIEQHIHENDRKFSYMEICNMLFRKAQDSNRLDNQTGYRYNNPVMTDSDALRISRLLWLKIWDKKIIIHFRENNYIQNYNKDTFFYIL